MPRPPLRFVLIALLPLLFVCAEFLLRHHAGPFWHWLHIDPSYFYLLNGLTLSVGETPSDIFHPGTPVHILVAVLLRMVHPFASTGEMAQSVLADPEFFLSLASTAIILLNALALFWLGRTAHRASGALLPALAAQASPFFTMFVLKQAYHVKPEPFLILGASLMGCFLFKAISCEKEGMQPSPVGFGLVSGFGMASKLLFLPIAAAPVFVLASRRKLIVYGALALLAFLAFLLPAAARWHVAVEYFSRMFLGTGAYGSGAATVVDWKSYPSDVIKVFAGKLVFDIFLAMSLAAILARFLRKLPRTIVWRALEGVCLAQLAMVLLVAKHPIAYYMVAAVSLTGIQAGLLLMASETLFQNKRWPRLAFACLLLVLAAGRVPSFLKDDAELADWWRQAQTLDMRPYESCTHVYFDFAADPLYALYMGDMMAGWRWGETLGRMYPAEDAVFMNFFTGDPRRWNERIDFPSEFAKRPCVVLRGGWQDAMLSYLQTLAPGAVLAGRCQAGKESLLTIGIEARCAP
jgi:hypothetical protein